MHAFVDASFYYCNSFPIGPLSHAYSLSRSGLGPSRAKVGFGSRLVGCVRRFRPPPLLWSVFGPSSDRFFFSHALQGFFPLWAGSVGIGVLPFPVLFCVPRLASRLSNCHLILIVTSLPFPFHLHLHLICRSVKKPCGSGACV